MIIGRRTAEEQILNEWHFPYNLKYLGRKPIELPQNFTEVVALRKSGEITTKKAMEKVEITANTFYRKMKAIEPTH